MKIYTVQDFRLTHNVEGPLQLHGVSVVLHRIIEILDICVDHGSVKRRGLLCCCPFASEYTTGALIGSSNFARTAKSRAACYLEKLIV